MVGGESRPPTRPSSSGAVSGYKAASEIDPETPQALARTRRDRLSIRNTTRSFDHSVRTSVRYLGRQEDPVETKLSSFFKCPSKDLSRIASSPGGTANLVSDISAVEKKNRYQLSPKAAPSHEPVAVEKQVVRHRNAIRREISIVLKTIGQLKVRIRVIEKGGEAVVFLFSKLFCQFKKEPLVEAIKSLESKLTEIQGAAV